jgi:molybdopterin converting factor small subunit
VNGREVPVRLDARNIMEIIDGYDVIVDGVDNFPTRYLLNDATVRLGIPVSRPHPRLRRPAVGLQAARRPVLPLPLSRPARRPSSRPSCGGQRRARRAARHDGLLQATEVVKLVTGAASRWSAACCSTRRSGATFTELKVRRDPECPICSRTRRRRSRTTEMGVFPDYEAFCAAAGLASASMATIKIPPSAVPPWAGEKEVTAAGDDVGAVLRALAEQHPATQSQLFGADGSLNRYVNVYLNDEDVRVLDGLETAVGECDTLVILPAMAGGAA